MILFRFVKHFAFLLLVFSVIAERPSHSVMSNLETGETFTRTLPSAPQEHIVTLVSGGNLEKHLKSLQSRKEISVPSAPEDHIVTLVSGGNLEKHLKSLQSRKEIIGSFFEVAQQFATKSGFAPILADLLTPFCIRPGPRHIFISEEKQSKALLEKLIAFPLPKNPGFRMGISATWSFSPRDKYHANTCEKCVNSTDCCRSINTVNPSLFVVKTPPKDLELFQQKYREALDGVVPFLKEILTSVSEGTFDKQKLPLLKQVLIQSTWTKVIQSMDAKKESPKIKNEVQEHLAFFAGSQLIKTDSHVMRVVREPQKKTPKPAIAFYPLEWN